MITYCPIDETACNCRCCAHGGCMRDAGQRMKLLKCPECDQLVPVAEFASVRCQECALARAVPA